MSISEISPVFFEKTTELAAMVPEFDAELVIFGVKHFQSHSQALMNNLPLLKEQGFSKIFVECPSNVNGALLAMQQGKKVDLTGKVAEPGWIEDAISYGFSVHAVDYDLEIRRKNGFDKALAQSMTASQQFNSFRDAKDELINQTVSVLRMSEQQHEELMIDSDMAFSLGDKTLQNFMTKWDVDPQKNNFLNNFNAFKKQALIHYTKSQELKRFNEPRNKYMAARTIQNLKNLKPNERALMQIGLGHADGHSENVSSDGTIQAMLGQHYDISTLTISLNGGDRTILSNPTVWTVIDKDELNPNVFGIYGVTKTELQTSMMGLNHKSFYVDQYDENNLSQPDVVVHLKQPLENGFI